MFRKLLLSTALVAAASSALAADLPMRSAPAYMAAPVFTWTGFYVGGTVGAVNLKDRAEHSTAFSDYCWWNCGTWTAKNTGVIAGVTTGYNWQVGSFVYGLEADLSGTSAKAKLDDFCGGGYCDLSQRSSLRALGTVRARLGYSFDRVLVYVTGGLAAADIQNRVVDNNDEGLFDKTQWRLGYTLGAGAEYAFSNNWSVKLEALYYNVGSKTIVSDSILNVDGNRVAVRFKDDGYLARLGVNYKF
jgi:outer membrane immunogenic protein